MNPFDYAKAAADFWTAQGHALMKAQQQAGRALADGVQAMATGTLPTLPEMPTDLSAGIADLANAGQSVMAMWSAASAMYRRLATTLPATSGGDTTVEATFRKMIDPRSWMAGTGEIDDVLGHMAEGPRFADLWEVERRYARVLAAWMTVRRRGLEHSAVVLEAWLNAGRRFTEEMAGRAGTGEPTPDAKATLALWTETANRQLLETQRSEPFLQTQAAMIRASTELRLAQQELVEHFGRQFGFPTRTELDDVHRTVTELRREMRAMRREQRAAASAKPIAPASRRAQAKGRSTRQ
jgi:polyhydroxyalkanoate synthase subunit PhaE